MSKKKAAPERVYDISNLNDLAECVAYCESGKKEINIAQIKEILRALGEVYAECTPEEVMKSVAKLIKKGRES